MVVVGNKELNKPFESRRAEPLFIPTLCSGPSPRLRRIVPVGHVNRTRRVTRTVTPVLESAALILRDCNASGLSQDESGAVELHRTRHHI